MRTRSITCTRGCSKAKFPYTALLVLGIRQRIDSKFSACWTKCPRQCPDPVTDVGFSRCLSGAMVTRVHPAISRPGFSRLQRPALAKACPRPRPATLTPRKRTPGAAAAQIALQVVWVTLVMEQAVTHRSVKFFQTQGSNINTIGR
jgi:hypothetical protein